MKRSRAWVASVLILCASLIGFSARAATITVTSVGDTVAADGFVTLREAINSINSGSNQSDVVATIVPNPYGTSDTINFNIGAGLHTISIGATALPPITKPVTIDGYALGAGTPNTLASDNNAVINIKLDGTSVTTPNPGEVGLRLDPGSSGSVIRGLDIVSFPGAGIRLFSSNNTVAGCWIGVNTAGVAAGNGTSITLSESPKAGILIGDNGLASTVTASNNTIGWNQPRGSQRHFRQSRRQRPDPTPLRRWKCCFRQCDRRKLHRYEQERHRDPYEHRRWDYGTAAWKQHCRRGNDRHHAGRGLHRVRVT